MPSKELFYYTRKGSNEEPKRLYATTSKPSVHDDDVQRVDPPRNGYEMTAYFTTSILPGSPIDRLFKRLEYEARMRKNSPNGL